MVASTSTIGTTFAWTSASRLLSRLLILQPAADDAEPQELVRHLRALPEAAAASNAAIQQVQQAAVDTCQGLLQQCRAWQQAQTSYTAAADQAREAEQVRKGWGLAAPEPGQCRAENSALMNTV